MRELLGWPGGLDVTGIKVYLVPRVVFRCADPLLVVIPSHVVF